MSRSERKQEQRSKKEARKVIYRFIFIIIMICIMSLGVFMIDKEATLMIGEVEEYNIEVFAKNLGKSVIKATKEIEENLSKLNNLR